MATSASRAFFLSDIEEQIRAAEDGLGYVTISVERLNELLDHMDELQRENHDLSSTVDALTDDYEVGEA